MNIIAQWGDIMDSIHQMSQGTLPVGSTASGSVWSALWNCIVYGAYHVASIGLYVAHAQKFTKKSQCATSMILGFFINAIVISVVNFGLLAVAMNPELPNYSVYTLLFAQHGVLASLMDHGMVALSPGWKIIDNDKFQWSKTILMDDAALARAHQIGINLANAAANIEEAKWMGPAGICPHCHTNNFYIEPGTTHAICGLCGMEGELEVKDGAIVINYPEEQYAMAHDTMSGKMAHGKDIQENEGRLADLQKNSPEFKARKQKYKEFIKPSVPER